MSFGHRRIQGFSIVIAEAKSGVVVARFDDVFSTEWIHGPILRILFEDESVLFFSMPPMHIMTYEEE